MKDFEPKSKNNYKKKGSKRKRNFSKTKGDKYTDFREEISEDTNDPAWYGKYPELMKTVSSIPYSIPTGAEINWDIEIDPSKPLSKTSPFAISWASVPGIMVLSVMPTPGLSKDGTSPINVAARLAYTKVRQENSGAKVYDWPDLMLYYLAMDQIYSFVTWMNRVYGCFMLYANQSRYVPAALLHAQKINFEDILSHGNDFKAWIDVITSQAAQMAVPNDISLYNRHAFMYQDVYQDAASIKSQMYMFVPHGFYKYEEMQGAGKLVPYILNDIFGSSDLTFANLQKIWNDLFSPIILSEDFAVMSGDTLKAFKENTIKLQLMPMGYTIVPHTDYEVLTQIKNATVNRQYATAGMGNTAASFEIWQDVNTNALIYDPVIASNSSGTYYNNVKSLWLSTYKDVPDESDNMVYTRLMNTTHTEVETGTVTTYNLKFDAVGSEFIAQVVVYGWRRNTNGDWILSPSFVSQASMYEWTTAQIYNAVGYASIAKHFDFSPALYVFMDNGSGNSFFYPIFDLDNWTIVRTYELEKMHNAAIMSMLRVPMIGSALGVPKVK